MSSAALKGLAYGFAVFLAYQAAQKYLVRPAAQKFGVPVLKDL